MDTNNQETDFESANQINDSSINDNNVDINENNDKNTENDSESIEILSIPSSDPEGSWQMMTDDEFEEVDYTPLLPAKTNHHLVGVSIDINSTEMGTMDTEGANHLEKLVLQGGILYVASHQAKDGTRTVISKKYLHKKPRPGVESSQQNDYDKGFKPDPIVTKKLPEKDMTCRASANVSECKILSDKLDHYVSKDNSDSVHIELLPKVVSVSGKPIEPGPSYKIEASDNSSGAGSNHQQQDRTKQSDPATKNDSGAYRSEAYMTEPDFNDHVKNVEASSINKRMHIANGNTDSGQLPIDTTEKPDDVKLDQGEIPLGPELIIAKLLNRPIEAVTPSATEWVRTQTEYVSRSHGGVQRFTPVSWPDPLSLAYLKFGSDAGPTADPKILPYHSVEVNSDSAVVRQQPALTPLGIAIEAIAAGSYQTAGLKALIPTPTSYDIASITTLGLIVRNISVGFVGDEAAFLRLILLGASYLEPKWYLRYSRLTQDISIDDNPRVTDMKKSMPTVIKLDEATDGYCVPASKKCRVWAMTLTKYVEMLSCIGPSRTVKYSEAKDSVSVELSDCVIVPVKRYWRGLPKLIPYILSFTSTQWWWFGTRLDYRTTSGSAAKEDDYRMLVHAYTAASTVKVPGKFANIILVLVDDQGSSKNGQQAYGIGSVGNGPKVNDVENPKDMTATFNNWLGRTDGTPSVSMRNDIIAAWRSMCGLLNVSGEKERAMGYASELCFTFFVGGGVESDKDEGKGLKGVATYGTADRTIGGHEVKAWDKQYQLDANTEKPDAHTHAKGIQVWRVTPLGRFYDSFLKADVGVPKDITQEHGSYIVTETQVEWRLLIACGYYERSKMCNLASYTNVHVMMTHAMGTASLIGGCTNWMLLNHGYTLMDWNDIDPQIATKMPSLDTTLSQLTLGFCNRAATNVRLPRNTANFVKPALFLLGYEEKDTDILYNFCSGFVPFWFINELAFKFLGKRWTCAIDPEVYVPNTSTNSSWKETTSDFAGYVYQESTMARNWNLAYVTQTLNYELQTPYGRAWFTVLMPDTNLVNVTVCPLGWRPYALIDDANADANLNNPRWQKRDDIINKGVVCLNVVIFPQIRSEVAKRRSEALVGSERHVVPEKPKTWIIDNDGDGLKYPDPVLSWITEGLKKAGIGFLEGGFSGAAAGALAHIAGTVLDKIRAWENSHAGSDTRQEVSPDS